MQVQYRKCQCKIQEELDVQIITDTSPIKLCLQTKWPTCELSWENDLAPSLN
jgi:hypothetical protein